MLVKINNVTFKNKVPFEIEKTKDQEEKINVIWEEFSKNKTDFYNGEIYVITNISNIGNDYTLEIGKAKFADLVYSKKTNDLTIYSLFTSCLFKTKDNYYLVLRDKNNRPNILGGMASDSDFINDEFIPQACLEREAKEELLISINDLNQVISYQKAFLKIPSTEEKMNPTGVVYVGQLNLTKDELIEHFSIHKNNLDHEIIDLLFYTKDNYLDILKEENTREYIVEAINLLEN